MITTLTFNTENPEETDELRRCMSADGMARVLVQLLNNGRKNYQGEIDAGRITTAEDMLETLLKDIGESLYNQNVIINNIIQ